MKRFFVASLLSLSLILLGIPAEAGGKHYRGYNKHGYEYGHGYGYRHGHRHGKHGNIGDGIIIGAAIIGGSILVSSLLSQPRYSPGARYPAVREPICEEDQVYRYLPDGRIQWGTRTRCY